MSDPGACQRSNSADTGRPEIHSVDALVATAVAGPGTGLAVGTFGALAEFLRPPGATIHVRHDAGVHTAVTDGGAVRVAAPRDVVARAWRRPTGPGTGWTHAVALCLPRERAAGPARTVVTELGPDHGAVDSADASAVLVDLGLGVAHLEACVRTADPDLLARLRVAAGRVLDAALSAVLVAAGPARVFRTVAARIEVSSPIPPPTGESPAGPHTHLLPALLAHGRTHAATDPIGDGEVPVAMIFPPHPTHDQLGRPHAHDPVADATFDRVLDAFGDPAEVRWGRWVHAAVARGVPAQAPPPGLSRAGRRGWETALRRREAADGRSDVLTAWRALAHPDTDEAVPFHEAHG